MASPPPPRGTQMRRDHGRLKVTTVTAHFITTEDEDRFLDHLAATSNVRASAKAVGFSENAFYRRRRLDAAFATRWQGALDQGIAAIQAGLVHAARAAVDGTLHDPDCPVGPISFDQAMNLLKLHAAAVGLSGMPQHRYGKPPRRRTLEELKDSLLRKIEAVRATHPESSVTTGQE